MPSVAIVTVSYRSDDHLESFLASVPTASSRAMPVVVVADNAPGQGDAISICARHGAVHEPMTRNLGYGGAVNAAVETLRERPDWVLVSNPDVILSPGCLDVMVDAATSDPRIGSIGPLIRNADGSVYPSARLVPSIRVGIGHAIFADIWPTNPWTARYQAQSHDANASRDAGWLSGACVLVRTTAFEQIGGFDDGFFMYFEDVDLGYRLGKAGWRNVYEPKAEVLHTGAHSTTGASSAPMIRAHHRSAATFIERKYPGRVLWPVRAVLLVGLRVRSFVVERRSH